MEIFEMSLFCCRFCGARSTEYNICDCIHNVLSEGIFEDASSSENTSFDIYYGFDINFESVYNGVTFYSLSCEDITHPFFIAYADEVPECPRCADEDRFLEELYNYLEGAYEDNSGEPMGSFRCCNDCGAYVGKCDDCGKSNFHSCAAGETLVYCECSRSSH